MLSVEVLYQLNELGIVLSLFAVLIVITEIGYRHGLMVSAAYGESGKTQLSTLQSAIGSTYLRAQMLAEPYRDDMIKLLRNYVDTRLDYFNAGVDAERLKDADDRTEEVQNQLWVETLAVTKRDPSPVPTGLFVSSLSDAFDVSAKRESARENHVPEVVLWLLFFVTMGSLEFVGFVCGVEKQRSLSRTLVIAVLLSLVILVIIDLDRPRRGFIEVSQQSMLELQSKLQSAP